MIDQHTQICPLVALSPAFKFMEGRLEEQDASLAAMRVENCALKIRMKELHVSLSQSRPLGQLQDADASPPSAVAMYESSTSTSDQPFDSPTHHLLSMHESLREELERVTRLITDLDGRISMMVMNENLRLKEDMTHMNAVISSMRMQLQWLTSARLQRAGPPTAATSNREQAPSTPVPGAPPRRLSDSTTKL